MAAEERTEVERTVVSCLIHLLESGREMITVVTDPTDGLLQVDRALENLLKKLKDEGEGPC